MRDEVVVVNDYWLGLVCVLLVGLLLGNIWGSISVRKTVKLGIDQNIEINKENLKYLSEKLENVVNDNGLTIAKEKNDIDAH